MPAFWNITMDRKMDKRFHQYRRKYEKEANRQITKAEFGRIIFDFWEKMNELDPEKEIERHMNEAAKLEHIIALKKMAG
jgi:hypothetical protein